MTPLRQRMIEDMRTAGLAPGTQALYLDEACEELIVPPGDLVPQAE
jgi:hypothetical protein